MKIFQRVLHAVAVIVIGLAALFASTIAALSMFVSKYLELMATKQMSEAGKGWIALPLTLLPLVCSGCFFAIRREIKWRWVVLAGLVVAAALGYFAYDTPQVPLADLGPRVSDDDIGYRTFMWMAEKSPYSRLSEPGIVNAEEAKALALPAKSENWAKFVQENRGLIMQAWTADKMGREWIDAINATPPKGVWPQGNSPSFVAFQPVRATCYIRMAYAYTVALEGRRDEAMAVLIPMIGAMHHYERTGDCLLNETIASVVLKRSYVVAAEIMKLGALSEDTRKILGEVLRTAPTIRQVIRHAFLGEQDFIRGTLDSINNMSMFSTKPPTSWAERWLKFFLATGGKWVIFNRNRTEQMGLDAMTEVLGFAEARNIDAVKQWVPECFRSAEKRNPVGLLIISMILPGVIKPTEGIWQAEDQRLELLRQLEKP